MYACILWKAEKAKYFKNVIMFACIPGFIAVQSDKYFAWSLCESILQIEFIMKLYYIIFYRLTFFFSLDFHSFSVGDMF